MKSGRQKDRPSNAAANAAGRLSSSASKTPKVIFNEEALEYRPQIPKAIKDLNNLLKKCNSDKNDLKDKRSIIDNIDKLISRGSAFGKDYFKDFFAELLYFIRLAPDNMARPQVLTDVKIWLADYLTVATEVKNALAAKKRKQLQEKTAIVTAAKESEEKKLNDLRLAEEKKQAEIHAERERRALIEAKAEDERRILAEAQVEADRQAAQLEVEKRKKIDDAAIKEFTDAMALLEAKRQNDERAKPEAKQNADAAEAAPKANAAAAAKVSEQNLPQEEPQPLAESKHSPHQGSSGDSTSDIHQAIAAAKPASRPSSPIRSPSRQQQPKLVAEQSPEPPNHRRAYYTILAGVYLIGFGVAATVFSFGIAAPISIAAIGLGSAVIGAGIQMRRENNKSYQALSKRSNNILDNPPARMWKTAASIFSGTLLLAAGITASILTFGIAPAIAMAALGVGSAVLGAGVVNAYRDRKRNDKTALKYNTVLGLARTVLNDVIPKSAEPEAVNTGIKLQNAKYKLDKTQGQEDLVIATHSNGLVIQFDIHKPKTALVQRNRFFANNGDGLSYQEMPMEEALKLTPRKI